MRLQHMTVASFVDQLSAGTPSPGGGSVAALCGALASALGGLVARLTRSKEGYNHVWPDMEHIRDKTTVFAERFLYLMEEDVQAYASFLETGHLPTETPEEEDIRDHFREQTMKKAVVVPLEVLRCCRDVVPLLRDVAALGCRVAVNDAITGLALIRGTVVSSCLTAITNLALLSDEEFCASVRNEALSLMYDLNMEIDRTLENYLKALVGHSQETLP
ncbi:cyclodeaminase/cyclohydrolase family protein [Aminobacterium mobile]|jgi:formiminotetrahydrofolate cyclodeaminase